MGEPLEMLPLPDDPALAEASSALNDAGHLAVVLDARWRIVFATDELRRIWDAAGNPTPSVGWHYYGPEMRQFRQARDGTPDGGLGIAVFGEQVVPYVLATREGNRELLRSVLPPEYADVVDAAEPKDLPAIRTSAEAEVRFTGARVRSRAITIRIDDGSGNVAGVAILSKPAAGMFSVWMATAMADLEHLERMRLVERADRRSAAILMADLESSSPLARRLSTAQYFAFGRRLVRTADQCIVDHGGLPGRHAGDGVVAFFLTETMGSESAAAAASISAARALRAALGDVAERSGVPGSDVSLRFGLHWGSTLYVGRIATVGRSEVTALGDEANEAARIEACATGGRTLASKALVERLSRSDAQVLSIDPDHTTYTPLAELATATEKARRDAPAIAVCDV